MPRRKKLTLQQQAEQILKKAEAKGVTSNFFFVTTFKRYQVQMGILHDLEQEIEEEGMTVEKEYVKGRKNVYVNPAVKEYNTTSAAANNTVLTLIKIVEGFVDDSSGTETKLGKFIRELEK